MDEWFLPHMAMGFACWALTNSAVNSLTVCPEKPVPCGWSVLCTLIMTWFWQPSSLQRTVRSPQGALADGFLCISQSFRHNLHQISNSSGVWHKLLQFRWSIFFLDDLKSLGQDPHSYGSMNTPLTCTPGRPAEQGPRRARLQAAAPRQHPQSCWPAPLNSRHPGYVAW